MERCTIVVVAARDKFSPTAACVETLLERTPEPHDLIVVAGGVPTHLAERWTGRFGSRARFIFEPAFLTQPAARNIGLRATTTRLAVLMDNDVFVRAGWLTPLIRCQQETGAGMVVPVVLETERTIHTAGNSLYVTYEHGRAYAHKELRFRGMPVGERTNLQRQRTDYGEVHCQLVQAEPARRLGVYDERLQEAVEVDSGLTWAKAGYEMWCEPASVVYFARGAQLTADDIRLFMWRWDLRAIREGHHHFQRKWNLDITEHGRFGDFLLRYNSRLGLLPRLFPSAAALALDRRIGQARQLIVEQCRAPKQAFRRMKARWMGYDEWAVRRS
jgi:GT2 family glycosyltransferase